MRKLLLLLVVVSLPSPANSQALLPAAADRPTVAVMEFDFAAVHQPWAVQLDIGRGIADLVTDGLVNANTFRVIEGRMLPSGKVGAAQYVVVGSVTKFGTENRRRGAAAILLAAAGAGFVNREKGKAAVTITARLVDAATGVVAASAIAEGTSSRSGLLLGGLARQGLGGLSMQSSAFRDTILGEAIEAAVKNLVAQLVAAGSGSRPHP